jgi:hypothetical protein
VEPLVSRRMVLGGIVAAAALAGCGSDTEEPVSTETSQPTPVDQVALSEATLIAVYSAVSAAHPTLAESLAPIADQHREHLVALGYPELPSVPTQQSAQNRSSAIEQCISAEIRAAEARQASCQSTEDPEMVRLLAIIAASEASHAPELERLRT